MKRLFLFVTLLAISATTIRAQQTIKQTNITPSNVQVTGIAEEYVTPDEIYISVTIRDVNNKTSKKSLEQQQTEMVKALTSMGIDTKNITVSDMASNLQEYILRKDAIKTSKNFQIKANSAQQVGEIFEALEKIGISEAAVTSYSFSQKEAKRNELRIKAAQNAQAIASTLATAIGQTIGKATEIREYGSVGFDSPVVTRMALTKVSDVTYNMTESAPNLDFKKMKLSVSVNITFSLK